MAIAIRDVRRLTGWAHALDNTYQRNEGAQEHERQQSGRHRPGGGYAAGSGRRLQLGSHLCGPKWRRNDRPF